MKTSIIASEDKEEINQPPNLDKDEANEFDTQVHDVEAGTPAATAPHQVQDVGNTSLEEGESADHDGWQAISPDLADYDLGWIGKEQVLEADASNSRRPEASKSQNSGVFVGEQINGRKNGFGVEWYCGAMYEGNWLDDQKHGEGEQTEADGSKYIGEYKAGMRNGFGILLMPDGTLFEGEWFNDKKHGYGVLQRADNVVEEGEWENDVLIESI